MEFEKARSVINSVLNEVSRVYVGKKDLVEIAVATLFSGGHLLIEGYPGTGKTLLAKSLAKVIGGVYRRVQGHPDVLPSDIIGFHIYRLDGTKQFIPGPIFANVLMIDELSRVPTRSQSALLEAMQEYQVTIDGVTYPLNKPFIVIATQVKQEIATGAFQIMETLVDRFAVSMSSLYNPPEEEIEIVEKSDSIITLPIEQVTTVEEVNSVVNSIASLVNVDRLIAEYIVRLISYIRSHDAVLYGPSHRASVHLMRISRVIALMDGRDYVIPDDVKRVAVPTIAHRVKLKEVYEVEGVKASLLVEEALKKIPVPK